MMCIFPSRLKYQLDIACMYQLTFVFVAEDMTTAGPPKLPSFLLRFVEVSITVISVQP
jgi:hypothetical protein